MLKKVVTFILLGIAVLIFCGYFAAASILARKGAREVLCTDVSVRILDSAVNRFVSPDDIKDILTSSATSPLGRSRNEINLHDIETLLNSRSAISKSDASLANDGILDISITQRRPVIRIQTGSGAFYIDDTGYIFPWVSTFTSYVPIVSGHIPVRLEEGYRGVPISLAQWLDRHPMWESLIQQIYVEDNGDIVFYTSVGDQKIIFGAVEDIDYKFAKLNAYYRQIVPAYGWEKYSTVNLKFSDQIVCTARNKKDMIKRTSI